jgi:hypothetical protein
MKTFKQLLINNKLSVKEYIEKNRQTSYEDHLKHAKSKNRTPLDKKEYLAALFDLIPDLLPKKESKPTTIKKKSVKRGRKRKGDK